jgi:aconitate hydratase
MKVRQRVSALIERTDGTEMVVELVSGIDTAEELGYFRHGGILHYVLRQLAA